MGYKGVWAFAETRFETGGFCRPHKFRQFEAKPFVAKLIAATFLPIAALLFAAGHLQQNSTLAAKIGDLQQNHLL